MATEVDRTGRRNARYLLSRSALRPDEPFARPVELARRLLALAKGAPSMAYSQAVRPRHSADGIDVGVQVWTYTADGEPIACIGRVFHPRLTGPALGRALTAAVHDERVARAELRQAA